jgi:small nuclear ribonucleoprotein
LSSDISLKILEKTLGGTVLVKLRNGKAIRGQLLGYDQHMNLVLEAAEEVRSEGELVKLGLIVVRGDNIVMISPSTLKMEEGGEG